MAAMAATAVLSSGEEEAHKRSVRWCHHARVRAGIAVLLIGVLQNCEAAPASKLLGHKVSIYHLCNVSSSSCRSVLCLVLGSIYRSRGGSALHAAVPDAGK
jgi:hypothetical protein